MSATVIAHFSLIMSFEKFLDVNWNTFVPRLPTENFFIVEGSSFHGLLKLL